MTATFCEENTMTKATTHLRRLVCIIGWLLLAGGLAAEICIFVYHRASFTVFARTAAQYAGRTLSEGDAQALWVVGNVSLAYARSSLYAVLATCIGGVLLFFSRRECTTLEKSRSTEQSTGE